MRKQVPIILTLTFLFSYRNVSIRLSLRELECNAEKKNDFLKAWKLIQELPPTNPNSFWSIASYHGMPFKGRQVPLLEDESEKDSSTWGGYCQHANVLFPFWHRLYCLRLEQALQSVLERGKERVALHYWDESSEETKKYGLPDIVTAEYVYIDKELVPNPLFKFKLPMPIKDDVPNTDPDSKFYEKEVGYDTCRYPYSGIRSPDAAKAAALAHNDTIDGTQAIPLLQENIIGWLNEGRRKRKSDYVGVAKQFKDCLETPEYNPFSNTASVRGDPSFTSLEQPHNDLHLAVGGFTQPETNEDGSVKQDSLGNIMWKGPIEGANGDMGANEVASYDPVFFFHHSNIDRMLWVWQKKHKKTNPSTFTIDNSDEEDEGISNSVQGATPYQTWGQKLNEKTILYPFQDEYGVPRTSSDCIDIVHQLGYDYSIGSLDQEHWPEPEKVKTDVSLLRTPSTRWQDIFDKLEKKSPTVTGLQRFRLIFDLTHLPAMTAPFPDRDKLKYFIQVKDVNKDKISGSFLVQVFYRATTGKLYCLGQRGVLSRWNRSNCANCQGRRMADISIPISGGDSAPFDPQNRENLQNLEVHLVSKDGMTGKYKREIKLSGKDLTKPVVPFAARSAPGEQKPSLRIFGLAS